MILEVTISPLKNVDFEESVEKSNILTHTPKICP